MGKDIHVKEEMGEESRSLVTSAIQLPENLPIIGRFSAGSVTVLCLPEVK
jgi:hypothetical protein